MSRRDAREAAMKLLYQHGLTGEYDMEALKESEEELSLSDSDVKYVEEVMEGYKAHQVEIMETIQQYARGWKVGRIAKVDLAILQLALYELMVREDIPASVSINEAVELAKKFGSDKSSSFINGILGRVQKEKGGEQSQ